ncbi:hypothetical protein DAKH74_011560 [Maudiozyma humilis]|uniref:Cation efflux protein transmembrane domain-containing protein n=1 Tax=Maudiozyma humilis TaxID=51915 RepID=A0AAV5RSV8_MAUHU|nr:hypothetical protein DAKH74_011560 [Kazachstania humilis]
MIQGSSKDGDVHSHAHSHDEPFVKSLLNGLYSHTHSHQPEGHSHAHSHSHSHTHANPLLVLDRDTIRRDAGVRVTWMGLGVNVAIAAGKFAGGIAFHSQALFADSIHALSDMVSDLLTLLSVRLAAGKPSPDYPFGYGKIETVGSLAVSTILMTAGLSIGWSSLCAILGPAIPHSIVDSLAALGGEAHAHAHAHSHIHAPQDITDINAAWIAALSIAAKEWIFRATKRVALATHSNVLLANAWHHRVDSLTSLVALVTISSGYLFSMQSLDMLGGLIVSALVVKAGAEGMRTAVSELVDRAVEHESEHYVQIQTLIRQALQKGSSAGIAHLSLSELVVLQSGPNLIAHARVTVPRGSDLQYSIACLASVSKKLRAELDHDVANFKDLQVEYREETEEPRVVKLTPHTHAPAHSHSHSHSHSHGHEHQH